MALIDQLKLCLLESNPARLQKGDPFLGTHEKFGYPRPGCGFQRYVRTERDLAAAEPNLAHGQRREVSYPRSRVIQCYA